MILTHAAATHRASEGSPTITVSDAASKALRTLCASVVAGITADLPANAVLPQDDATKQETRRRIEAYLRSDHSRLDEVARATVTTDAMNDLFAFGPIQPLLDDPTVTEVMVNRADRVYVERAGRSMLTDVKFDDDAHVRRLINRIIVPIGRRINKQTPLVDARLPDGSRVNAVIPPVSIDGANITIRKFGTRRLTVEDLIQFGAMTPALAEFLKACVVGRLNIVVAGGTGSGKTTLLNVLSSFIPDHERIVTIEDAAELKLAQDHVVRMESQKPDLDGSGEVTIRELVRNALRMRPERIVVGECRGGETLDMLQAMNTGHDGSLTTLHANTPRDAISRIETMSLMGGIDFPIRVVREQMSSAIQLIVQQARLRDGTRRITYVTEIAGMEGDRVVLQELFRFHDEGVDADGKVKGTLRPTGLQPQCAHKLEQVGFKFNSSMFAGNGAPERMMAPQPAAPAPSTGGTFGGIFGRRG